MAAVSQVTGTNSQVSPFSPQQPQQMSFDAFNVKFQGYRAALEGAPVENETSRPLVAPGVSECIVLFAIHVDRATQQIEWYCGFHMDIDSDSNIVDDFMIGLDDERYDLYIYLIGGNEKHSNHGGFLNIIKTSLSQAFGNKNHIVAERINLINHPHSTSKTISIGLTKNGEVCWCYEPPQ